VSISEQEIQTAEAVARIAGAVAPDLFRWIAELFRQGHTEEEVLEIVNIQSRRERYERERAEDVAALDAKHAGVSVVVNGRRVEVPARATYEQLVAAAGSAGQPTVIVRGAGESKSVLPGQTTHLFADAIVNVAHTGDA